MPTCNIHGFYSGRTCFQCDVEESLRQQKQAIEGAEDNAALRHWEAEAAANQRARELAQEQRALVQNANKIRAKELHKRARDLFNAQLFEEAIETCRDSLREDRGFLPAYATLAAALYEAGDLSAAEEPMRKAIRLIGHGEWTGPKPLSTLLSWLGQRDFPLSVTTPLRDILRSYRGEVDGDLLLWISERGWEEEVLQLLPRAKAGPADLISTAEWLLRKGAVRAAGEVVSRAVPLTDKGTPEAWNQFIKIALQMTQLELLGKESEGLSKVVERAKGWSHKEGLDFLRFLASSTALKTQEEIIRMMFLATIAGLISHWLNVAEFRSIEERLSNLPKRSSLLSWIPAIQQQDEETNARNKQEAVDALRKEIIPLLKACEIDRFLVLGIRWMTEVSAVQRAKTCYIGLCSYKQALIAEKNCDWQSALSIFATAQKHFEEALNDKGQGYSLFRLGVCYEKLRDWPMAIEAFQRAREHHSMSNNSLEALNSLREIGWCTCPNNNERGNWEEAYSLFRQGEALAAKAESKALLASFIYWQGWCQEPANNPQGDWITCIELYKRAATEAHEVESLLEADSLHAVGFCYEPIHAPFGDWPTAVEWYRRAIPIWRKIENKGRLANSLVCLAKSLSQGDRARVTPEALELFREASSLKQILGDTTGVTEAEEWIRGGE